MPLPLIRMILEARPYTNQIHQMVRVDIASLGLLVAGLILLDSKTVEDQHPDGECGPSYCVVDLSNQ